MNTLILIYYFYDYIIKKENIIKQMQHNVCKI